jgi:WS/DGAT/MGAT family acyltransferase
MERLAGIDASFLYMETPQVHMSVGFACILDPGDSGYDADAVIKHVEERASCHRVFRRRLARVPFDLHHPLWVDDPDFDVIRHVHRTALPAPGGPEEFGAMVGRLSSAPLDRAKPLWEIWVIEGLEGGRLGFVLRTHHSVVDGVSGAGLLMHFFDKSRTTIAPPAPLPTEPDKVPTDAELFAYALRSRMMAPVELGRTLGRTLKKASALFRDQISEGRPSGTRPLGAPRTPFNASVSSRRNLATMRVSLQDIRQIKKALDCTVNDVILATAGGGLRTYLQKRDALPEESLTAACPVSVRTEAQSLEFNNKVDVLWTTLATDTDDPIKRTERIHASTLIAKTEFKAMGGDTLQSWAEFAGPRLFHVAVRAYSSQHLADRHRPVHNLVISNVPGPREALYLAGLKLHAVYPTGPVMEGMGLNLTVYSYGGDVDFGFFVDSKLVPDAWDLARAAKGAFEELRESVRSRPEPPRPDPG